MQRSNREFVVFSICALLLLTVFSVQPMALADTAEASSAASPAELDRTPAVGESRAAVEAESEPVRCADEAEVSLFESFAPSQDVELAAGPPCCRTACDAICGVGQRCVCKSCQVLACEL